MVVTPVYLQTHTSTVKTENVESSASSEESSEEISNSRPHPIAVKKIAVQRKRKIVKEKEKKFIRCPVHLKHLCESCSKEDCMECTNCK